MNKQWPGRAERKGGRNNEKEKEKQMGKEERTGVTTTVHLQCDENMHNSTQISSTGLRHPSSDHCHSWLLLRSQKGGS